MLREACSPLDSRMACGCRKRMVESGMAMSLRATRLSERVVARIRIWVAGSIDSAV
jgi:hypothetical protein